MKNNKYKQVVKGMDISKATEDELNDLHTYELIDIVLFYRKELERKEQECEEWQTQLAYKESELQHIEKTIKPLMKRPDDLDCYDLEWIACAFADEFNQLKKENEQLKKSVRSNKDKRKRAIERYLKLKKFTNKEFNKLKAENDELKEKIKAYDEVYSNHDVLNERNNYKQALQEIKKIAEDDCKTCTVKLLGEDEINCKRCYKTKILQKCEVIKDE